MAGLAVCLRTRPCQTHNMLSVPAGAEVANFTLQCPRELAFLPKDNQVPEGKAMLLATAASISTAMMAASGTTWDKELVDMFWSFQHHAVGNQLVPIKPSVALIRSITIPADKYILLTKTN